MTDVSTVSAGLEHDQFYKLAVNLKNIANEEPLRVVAGHLGHFISATRPLAIWAAAE